MRAPGLFAVAVFALAVVETPSARAQVVAPAVVSPSQTPFGDRGGDAGGFDGYFLTAPLRLSLEASVAPKASMFPQCATLEDDVGNSVGGIPVQHESDFRLTPRLQLSVFTQLGCPIDAGIGTALTYAIPIRRTTQLVLGLGAYAAPGPFPLFGGLKSSILQGLRSAPSPLNEAGRADVVWKAKNGAPFDVGVESRGLGMQGIRFGGGF
jgi:hypothetical protein